MALVLQNTKRIAPYYIAICGLCGSGVIFFFILSRKRQDFGPPPGGGGVVLRKRVFEREIVMPSLYNRCLTRLSLRAQVSGI